MPWLPAIEGELAMDRGQFNDAQKHFREALRQYPKRADLALMLGVAIVSNKVDAGRRGPQLEALVEQFPDNGPLVCFYAVALAEDDSMAAAGRQLRRARALGTDPSKILSPEVVSQIERAAAPWLLLQTFGWTMLGFAAVYAVIMVFMAAVGVLLARRTRGNRALHLLGAQPEELITHGMVARTSEESSLAKLYALAIIVGLI